MIAYFELRPWLKPWQCTASNRDNFKLTSPKPCRKEKIFSSISLTRSWKGVQRNFTVSHQTRPWTVDIQRAAASFFVHLDKVDQSTVIVERAFRALHLLLHWWTGFKYLPKVYFGKMRKLQTTWKCLLKRIKKISLAWSLNLEQSPHKVCRWLLEQKWESEVNKELCRIHLLDGRQRKTEWDSVHPKRFLGPLSPQKIWTFISSILLTQHKGIKRIRFYEEGAQSLIQGRSSPKV